MRPAAPSRRFGRILAGAFVAVGLASAAASVPGCSSAPDNVQLTPCPPGETCQVRLTLLHSADIHSRLLPYDLLITQVDGDLGLGPTGEVHNVGGAARMAYVINRERARSERVLHLSGGDVFQGAPIFNFFNGEPEMRVQSALGIDAMAIANHEFDKGPLAVYRQIQRWASFPVLAANYRFEDPSLPGNVPLGTVIQPFSVFNQGGLKVGVVGMANLSSLTGIFDQPNKYGIMPIATVEAAQFYIDLLRPMVDVVVFTTHLGLEVDQRMIRETTGIDVVLGSHNHIVINPPQVLRDCNADPQSPGFVWAMDPNLVIVPGDAPPHDDGVHTDPVNHPYQFRRPCTPRNVLLVHSGAFAKYVGRLDLVLSNDPKDASPTGDPKDYQKLNGFEVVSNKYQSFPINESVPEDPVVQQLLEPYKRQLAVAADLNILVGFSPNGAKRTAPQGGDSPLGNMVATAAWLRLGVQTDFSMTNSTGIRQDLLPGPVTIEQMYNIFPFDNSITKMQLSGIEVEEMFDFIARRSASRGCASQAQIAGVRVRINCDGCTRTAFRQTCNTSADCPSTSTGCDTTKKVCNLAACAENVYIGSAQNPDGTAKKCQSDADCKDDQGNPELGACSKRGIGDTGVCLTPLIETNLYELSTSNYLAGGGSGFRVLQRNTTQFDTKIQQRDALVDYMRQGRPCGWKKDAGTAEGLKACGSDTDCATEGNNFVCACAGTTQVGNGTDITCKSAASCDPAVGRCVRSDCRTQLAQFKAARCVGSTEPTCQDDLAPCDAGGQLCQIVSCVDDTLGAVTDNRIQMIGR